MDVNFNSQLGTSIPLADIVDTGSNYIKFSNGIAIAYLSSQYTYPSNGSFIVDYTYAYEMTIYSPITFTSVLYFLMSMNVNTYVGTSSGRHTITKNATTTKYSTTDNRTFTVAPIIDMSGYGLHDKYAASFDTRINNVSYIIIGRWK